MKIRSRLTLQFSLIVAAILILFSSAIYYFSSSYRKQEFYSRLKEKALTTAKFLSQDVKEISPELLKIIDKNMIALPDEKIVIYDYNNKQLYSSTDDTPNVSVDFLNKIKIKKEIRYAEDEKEILGIVFEGQYDRYVVFASAFDKYGKSKLGFLQLILIIGFFVTIGITVVAGLFYSRQALTPIANVVNQVEKITVSNLDSRVNEGNGTDEIGQLSITFNKMLDRLESAFEMQRSFVSNASHELRTPLTTITGQIDVTLMKKRTADEYELMLNSIYEDIINLSRLSNGLLDLAQASLDISKISFKHIRVDELLWLSRTELLKRQNDYSITIRFENFPEDETQLQLSGNDQLLKTAFVNLIDNACKFSSDKSVVVLLNISQGKALLYFKDSGIGIAEPEVGQIFEPFYRAENAKNIKGHGLGLSLTEKIIQLHRGTIAISSQINKGTTVSVTLPIGSLS